MRAAGRGVRVVHFQFAFGESDRPCCILTIYVRIIAADSVNDEGLSAIAHRVIAKLRYYAGGPRAVSADKLTALRGFIVLLLI